MSDDFPTYVPVDYLDSVVRGLIDGTRQGFETSDDPELRRAVSLVTMSLELSWGAIKPQIVGQPAHALFIEEVSKGV